MRIKNIEITLEDFEPVITVYKKGYNRTTKTKNYAFHYFRVLKCIIDNYFIKRKLIEIGICPQKCQGCGMGWAEWSIEDPNENRFTKRKLLVCVHCVGFYDWKSTKTRLFNFGILDYCN